MSLSADWDGTVVPDGNPFPEDSSDNSSDSIGADQGNRAKETNLNGTSTRGDVSPDSAVSTDSTVLSPSGLDRQEDPYIRDAALASA